MNNIMNHYKSWQSDELSQIQLKNLTWLIELNNWTQPDLSDEFSLSQVQVIWLKQHVYLLRSDLRCLKY